MMIYDITVSEAKRDFERGFLKGFSVFRLFDQGSDGWHQPVWFVEFDSTAGKQRLVDTRTRKVRHFKSFDGLISTMESIGFKVSSVSYVG